MSSPDQIKRFIENTKINTVPDTNQEVLNELFSELDRAKELEPVKQPNIWRIIMKNRITKFAAAAVIIIAVIIVFNQFGGSIDGTSMAFADVLENISNAKNAVYKQTYELSDHTFTNEIMALESGIQRNNIISTGSIMIFDSKSHTFLWLDPLSKKARRTLNPGQKRRTKGFTYIGWIRKLHDEEAKFVGTEELKGGTVNVYVWEVPFEKITVWVDPETNLPVKVEHRRFANKERNIVAPELSLSLADFGGDAGHMKTSGISSGRSSGLGIQNEETTTMFDFQWDVELDESLFSLEPPQGYAFEEEVQDPRPEGQDCLVYALAFWAKMNEGAFPASAELNDPESFKPLLIEKFDIGGDPKKELDLAMKEGTKILHGIYFVQEKKVDGSWAYAGDGVKLGDADAAICWWKSEDSDGYRVIYGDLSIGDSPREPQLYEGK